MGLIQRASGLWAVPPPPPPVLSQHLLSRKGLITAIYPSTQKGLLGTGGRNLVGRGWEAVLKVHMQNKYLELTHIQKLPLEDPSLNSCIPRLPTLFHACEILPTIVSKVTFARVDSWTPGSLSGPQWPLNLVTSKWNSLKSQEIIHNVMSTVLRV